MIERMKSSRAGRRGQVGDPSTRQTGYTEPMYGSGSGRGRDSVENKDSLYFFPDQRITEQEFLHLLHQGTPEQRAWVISHLLRYAQWDDIWTYVTRDEVRDIFPALDLPESLRQAWGRMLKVEAPVG